MCLKVLLCVCAALLVNVKCTPYGENTLPKDGDNDVKVLASNLSEEQQKELVECATASAAKRQGAIELISWDLLTRAANVTRLSYESWQMVAYSPPIWGGIYAPKYYILLQIGQNYYSLWAYEEILKN